MRAGIRRVLVAAVLVAAAVGAPVAWYQVSVEPGAAIVRAVFEGGDLVIPGDGVDLDPPGLVESPGVPVPVAGDAPDATLDLAAPAGAAGLPVVLWIHGGGFVANSSADVVGYARVLAHAGYLVAALDYALAPAHRYPVPIEQAEAALAWLVAHAAEYGGDAERIVLGGDSAGAQLASQLAAIETDAATAARVGVDRSAAGRIRAVVLFCGLYDLRTVGATGFPALRTMLWAYTGHRDWTAFSRIDELSTVETATAGYPPTLLAAGDADPFTSQAVELADALRGLGVDVELEIAAGGLGHEYQFDFRLPEAHATLDATLAFLAARTTPGSPAGGAR